MSIILSTFPQRCCPVPPLRGPASAGGWIGRSSGTVTAHIGRFEIRAKAPTPTYSSLEYRVQYGRRPPAGSNHDMA